MTPKSHRTKMVDKDDDDDDDGVVVVDDIAGTRMGGIS